MTKKHDSPQSEQGRGPHPDQQQAGTGKLANDHNKMGDQQPTQVNQGQRTPASRNDQEAMGTGGHNQVAARKGGGGAGRTPRGAG